MNVIARLGVVLCCLMVFACGRAEKPKNHVEVWHWMTDRHDAFVELAARYKEETGVDVKFELFAPSDAYTQKVIAAAQAKALPEVYGILDKKSIQAKFVKAGYVADLTSHMNAENGAWRKSFFPRALAVNEFKEGNVYDVKPGYYGVPLDVTNIQMLYNRKLLAKAGIADVPQTFDEFLAAIEKLKLIGVPGLVSGFGELWMLDCLANNFAFNIMGEEKVLATYRGEVPYTDPDWVKVFDVFKQLTEKGALADGVVTKGNKFAEQDFALERAAFAFNGSWCVNVYNDMNPELQYGVMLPPKVNPERPMTVWGGGGASFVVNGTSSNKEVAIEFLRWLSSREQQAYLAMETKNLPANKQALTSIPEVLADFSKVMDNTTHPSTWPVNEDPLVGETFTKGIQSIMIAEKTPEQVAQEVQTVKERQMQRR